MKNLLKSIGIIALVMITGFTLSCGDDGDGLPPAGDGSITFPLTGSVYVWDDDDDDYVSYSGAETTRNYSLYFNEENQSAELVELSELGSGTWNVSISSIGALSLTLGTPDNNRLWDVSENMPPGISMTSGLKYLNIGSFGNSSGGNLLMWRNPDIFGLVIVGFVYANMNGKVSGRSEYYDEDDNENVVLLMNWDLKQGWNIVLASYTYNNATNTSTQTSVTGKPNSNFIWVLEDWVFGY